jgi:hypothetical protein
VQEPHYKCRFVCLQTSAIKSKLQLPPLILYTVTSGYQLWMSDFQLRPWQARVFIRKVIQVSGMGSLGLCQWLPNVTKPWAPFAFSCANLRASRWQMTSWGLTLTWGRKTASGTWVFWTQCLDCSAILTYYLCFLIQKRNLHCLDIVSSRAPGTAPVVRICA